MKRTTYEQRTENLKRFGTALRCILARRRMRPVDLRDKTEGKLNNITRILNGDTNPTGKTLHLIASALDIPHDVIVRMHNGDIPPEYDFERLVPVEPPPMIEPKVVIPQPQVTLIGNGMARVRAVVDHTLPLSAAMELAAILAGEKDAG